MLSMEYGENYRWVPYVAYSVATGVGVLRIAHDKHYWSDVIFGAGLGNFIHQNRLLDASISMEQKSEKTISTILYKEHL